MTERVFLSLGSNVGDRRGYLEEALARLEAEAIHVVRTSSVYETAPWGPVPQGPFLNLVAEVRTTLEPRALLACAQRVETALGRARQVRWGPRTVDVDVLLYGDRVVCEPDLEIPHPRLRQRAFVLVPLFEVAPDLVLPDGTPLRDLVGAVADQEVRRL
ncbi:2-amino-4-hydroxy-6-hydroxymethyldihydropteridine pyrophosphokinase [bacterium HR32]|jgi:2-amino-4-hydroxy-6-hydroxymethyldihydropteridine diphosphokinase|nr:2-amino-4-hydroxy-6-hydroxymethyldihydropteridine pyrophosphokinase [bacterium HR32]